MKIGLVGYQRSGKSSLFGWLTGVAPDPAHAHSGQSAMATVHDPRIHQLAAIYHPKKITEAAIELIDTPGLARDHKGSAGRLGLIRDVDCLTVVVGAYGGGDAAKDLASFEEDLALADLEIVSGRIGRVEESLKKPRPDREQLKTELAFLQRVQAALEAGRAVRDLEISRDEEKMIRSFQLISLKPKLALVNTADDESQPQRFAKIAGETPVIPVPIGLESELARMAPDERAAFREELGVASFDRDDLVRRIMDASGQLLFFTAGEKEVRSWLFHKGGTAVEAAGGIHTDLARGFIRAETMACADLVRLGSEREMKAAGLMRNEPKDYVVKDGDVITIKFSV